MGAQQPVIQARHQFAVQRFAPRSTNRDVTFTPLPQRGPHVQMTPFRCGFRQPHNNGRRFRGLAMLSRQGSRQQTQPLSQKETLDKVNRDLNRSQAPQINQQPAVGVRQPRLTGANQDQ